MLPLARHWPPKLIHTARMRIATPCVVCDLNPGDPVCAGCERDYFSTAQPRCAACAIRLPGLSTARCGSCMRQPPHFDATLALGDYSPPLDGMIAALKFGGRLPLAVVFGRLLARKAQQCDLADGLVVSVPLAFERHAERGFNQAQEIARRVAQELALDTAADAVLRIRHSAPQQTLALEARRRNVRGAFVVRTPVAERHVLVVDDVMTTGSTLNEVARVLKRAGAARVTNLVVARTP